MMVPFWSALKIRGRYYNKDPNRDHNFDNHTNGFPVSFVQLTGLPSRPAMMLVDDQTPHKSDCTLGIMEYKLETTLVFWLSVGVI